MTIADLNSDGRADFLDVRSGAPVAWINGANDQLVKETWPGLQAQPGVPLPDILALRVTTDFPNSHSDTTQDFFDLDGDGFPDIVYLTPDASIAYCPGTGSSFGICVLYAGPMGPGVLRSENRQFAGWSVTTVDIADFNGDGYPDILEVEGSTLTVHLNHGVGLAFTELTTAMPNSQQGFFPGALRITEQIQGPDMNLPILVETKDVNGDGLPDFLTTDRDGFIWVNYGIGSGFVATPVQLTTAAIAPTIGGGYTSGGGDYISLYDLVDMNGDGMADFVHYDCRDGAQTLSVHFNNGGAWDSGTRTYTLSTQPASPFYDPPCMNRSVNPNGLEVTTTAMLVDFNGDGRPDFVSADLDSGPYRTVLVRELDSSAPRMMTDAVSLTGHHSMHVSYTWLDGDTPYPVYIPFQVVRSRTPLFTAEPGRQTTLTTNYSYSIPTYSRVEHAFTGFASVTRVDDTFGAVTTSGYDTNFVTSGLLLSRLAQNQSASGAPVTDTYTYFYQNTGGPIWAKLVKKEELIGQLGGNGRLVETDYNLYDGYGQVTDWIDKGDPNDPSDDITHHRTYVSRWDSSFLLDLVSVETGSSAAGALSTTRNYWDDPVNLGATPTNGDLRKAEHEKTTGVYVSRQATYDANGMKATETDEMGAVTTYVYDATYHRYPLQTNDPIGIVYKSFHALTGQVADTCGPQYLTSGGTTSWDCSRTEIDVLGRPINIYVPAWQGNTYIKQLLTSITYDDVDYPLSMTEVVRGTSHRVQYRDGFGNPTEVRLEVTTNNYRVFETGYDAFGFPLRAELPHVEVGSAYTHTPISTEAWTYNHDYVHKAIERVTHPRDPGDNSPAATATRVIYADHVAMVDEDARETDYNLDFQGRITSIDRLGGASGTQHTAFGYDAAGRVISVTDPTDLQTTYGRNLLGWIDPVTTPDTSVWHYTYNNRGQVLTSTDPRGVIITNTYDTPGRLTHILSSSEPTGVRHVDATNVYYDATSGTPYIGRLYSESSDGITMQYQYTPEGAVSTLDLESASAQGTVSFNYDIGARLASVVYPDVQQATYHYNLDDSIEHVGWGFPGSETSSVATYVYQQDGQPLDLTNDFGLSETYVHDARGRLTQVASKNLNYSSIENFVDDRLTLSKASLVNELDRYGLAPNLVTRDTPDVFVNTVDGFGQLTHVTKNGDQWADYAYSLAGRLTVFNETPDTMSCSTTFVADKTTSRTWGANALSRTWTYDQAGNVTHNDYSIMGGVVDYHDHSWDALGRYVQTSGPSGTTIYYYTPSGKLARITGPGETSSASDVMNIGDWARVDLVRGLYIDRVLANGKMIAEQNFDDQFVTHFEMPHRTYDGSVLAVTNETGAVIRQEEFLPYGLRSSGEADGFFEDHFQGNRVDKFMVAGTRAYDANGGIWLGRDPLPLRNPKAVLGDSRLAATYQVDFGNPSGYTDRSGNDPDPRDAPDVYRKTGPDDPQQVIDFHASIGAKYGAARVPYLAMSAPLIAGSLSMVGLVLAEGATVALPIAGRAVATAASSAMTRLTVATGAAMSRLNNCSGGVEETAENVPETDAVVVPGAGAASRSEFIEKVVNTNMGHASEQAVARAGFSSLREAREALQAFGTELEEGGTLPANAIFDSAHADRVIVPGFGQGGAVVYQVLLRDEGAVYRLKTVLEWRGGN